MGWRRIVYIQIEKRTDKSCSSTFEEGHWNNSYKTIFCSIPSSAKQNYNVLLILMNLQTVEQHLLLIMYSQNYEEIMTCFCSAERVQWLVKLVKQMFPRLQSQKPILARTHSQALALALT